jgi:hypothetical protein
MGGIIDLKAYIFENELSGRKAHAQLKHTRLSTLRENIKN